MDSIWLDVPEIGLKERIFALLVEKDLFEIQEIPFISKTVNYHDIVRCEPFLEGYFDFAEVIKPSGYSTIHVAFAQNMSLVEKKKIVGDLLQLGVNYRRSGLSAFAFSICPKPAKEKALAFISTLFQTNILVDDDRKNSGPVENVMANLGSLFSPPQLNDGLSDDAEMDYFPRR